MVALFLFVSLSFFPAPVSFRYVCYSFLSLSLLGEERKKQTTLETGGLFILFAGKLNVQNSPWRTPKTRRDALKADLSDFGQRLATLTLPGNQNGRKRH